MLPSPGAWLPCLHCCHTEASPLHQATILLPISILSPKSNNILRRAERWFSSFLFSSTSLWSLEECETLITLGRKRSPWFPRLRISLPLPLSPASPSANALPTNSSSLTTFYFQVLGYLKLSLTSGTWHMLTVLILECTSCYILNGCSYGFSPLPSRWQNKCHLFMDTCLTPVSSHL